MSRVTVEGVHSEYLFHWFWYTVGEPCGDGAACICCGNPEETSDEFIKWWKRGHLVEMQHRGYRRDEFYHPRDEYKGSDGELIVNYHDSNENFMFCDKEIDLGFGDISFIVTKDCVAFRDGFIIRGLT